MSDLKLPSIHEIKELSRMAQLAFAAHSIRLLEGLEPAFQKIDPPYLRILCVVESLAEIEDLNSRAFWELSRELHGLRTHISIPPFFPSSPDVKTVENAIRSTMDAALDDINDRYITQESYEKIAQSIYIIRDGTQSYFKEPGAENWIKIVSDDFHLISDANVKGLWDDSTPVPPSFFATNSKFDTNNRVTREKLNNILTYFTPKNVGHYKLFPEDATKLSAREFEELVGELFARAGFKVELTAQTRDGGKDIIAVSNGEFNRTKLLIECKRWSPTRKIGIGVVQRLHGVVRAEKATKGIIVTTAPFSGPANEFIGENKWLIEGHTLANLIDWLDRYDMNRLLRKFD